MKYLIPFLTFLIGVGASLLSIQPSVDDQLGAMPVRGDYPCIYNATTTDNILNDGYGGAVSCDQHGRLIISPSTTINLTT